MPRFLLHYSRGGMPISRRDWLSMGLGALALSRSQAVPAPVSRPRAKAVLVVFAGGGQSQIDTWDPKPNAPEEIRGAFASIATAVPGVRICEHLPQTARLAEKFTILRSMTHDDLDHGSACYLALTGQFHPRKSSNPEPQPSDFPTLGALLQRLRPADQLPHASFQVNGPLLVPELISPGRSGGFLGRTYDPIQTGDPDQAADFLEQLTRPADIDPDRTEARRQLQRRLGRRTPDAEALALESSCRRVYDLLQNNRIRAAFDLQRESDRTRERYGRYRAGQACLLGRRLIEAGVPWVTVFFNPSIRGQDKHPDQTDAYGWDTHNDIFDALKTHLLPRFDQTFAALLQDMDQRGLLNDTLVVAMGEFGRAPRVAREANFAGTSPGRKHWSACYSVVLAGAGIPGGVYGSSDRQGGYPQADPATPGDLAATLFHVLGFDSGTQYTDLAQRPHRLTTGEPLRKLWGK